MYQVLKVHPVTDNLFNSILIIRIRISLLLIHLSRCSQFDDLYNSLRRGLHLTYFPNCFQAASSYPFPCFYNALVNSSIYLQIDFHFVVAYNQCQFTVKVSLSCFISDFEAVLLSECNFGFEFTLYLMLKFANAFELALLHG